MKILGITGGIGAGKSTILSILKQEYHAYVVEADRLAQELMTPGNALYDRILKLFTDYRKEHPDHPDRDSELVLEQGEFNRPLIAKLIYADQELLRSMNAMVHPAVKDAILADIRKQETELFVIEAALLIEDGYHAICDELWYIYADQDTRIRRLMKSRNYSYEKCRSIMEAQSSDEYYRKYTTCTIDNSGDLLAARMQVAQRLAHFDKY